MDVNVYKVEVRLNSGKAPTIITTVREPDGTIARHSSQLLPGMTVAELMKDHTVELSKKTALARSMKAARQEPLFEQ